MRFDVNHGGGYTDGLTVSGSEGDWVNGTFTSLNETIDAVRPQNHWVLRHQALVLHLLAISIGIMIQWTFSWILSVRGVSPTTAPAAMVPFILFLKANPWLVYVVYIGGMWLSGLYWALPIRNWLLKLWPETELDLGPDHFKTEKGRRERLAFVMLVILIPIGVNLASELAGRSLLGTKQPTDSGTTSPQPATVADR